jgi:signal transduction histidine kinase
MSKFKKLTEEKAMALRLILDNSSEGFLYFGQDLIVKEDYSLECIKIFKKEIEGSSICDLISPDNLSERSRTQDLLSMIFNEENIANANILLSKITNEISINDRTINIDFKIIDAHTYEAKDRYIIVRLNDITEKREFEKQIIKLEKLSEVGGLVAGVAHEVNTLIGVCVTAISFQLKKVTAMEESFKNNKIGKNDFQEFLSLLSDINSIIFSNLERVSVFIKDFKRVSVDMTHEECMNFFVKKQIDSILNALSPQLKQTKHKINVICDENLEISSFPGSFSQIITNFITNSLIHGFDEQQSGNISITAEKYQDYVQLVYSDDGKGIPSENLDKIFNPFYTTKKSQGGTGLGLNIIFNIVTKTLKGTITCKSTESKGTSFIIKIPLQTP